MTERLPAILRTADPVAELRWNALLEMQVQTYLPYELHYFLTWARWPGVRRVLDAGCGNGAFLANLRRFFPDKAYTGLDVSGELVSAARQNPLLDGVPVEQGDFFAYLPTAPFDVVLMRLIVQHMTGVNEILQQLERLLHRGGSAIIIEPEPRMFLNYPGTPILESLLAAYSEAMARKNVNRAALAGLGEQVARQRNWALRQDRVLVAPFLGPFRNGALHQIFALWIDLFEQSGAVSFDFEAARSELSRWAELDVSYSQIGVRILEAEYVGSPDGRDPRH